MFLIINGFNTSSIKGCQLLDVGEVEMASPRRADTATVYGANGRLDHLDGAFDGYERTWTFLVKSLEDISVLLGHFVVSDNVVEYGYQLGSVFYCDLLSSSYQPYGLHHWQVTCKVYHHPFRYLKAIAPTVLTSGGVVVNTGSVYSEPVISIEGSGKVSLTIGKQTMHLTVDGKATIDCRHKRQNIYDKSGAVKNTIRERGPFFEIPVGTSGVSWSGSVSKVTIDGNWRYLI